jgi:hypothetical protein
VGADFMQGEGGAVVPERSQYGGGLLASKHGQAQEISIEAERGLQSANVLNESADGQVDRRDRRHVALAARTS